MRDEIKKTRSELQDFREVNSDVYEKQLKDLEEKINELSNEVISQDKYLTELKSKIENSTFEQNENKAINDLNKTTGSLHNEINNIVKEKEELQIISDRLTSDNNELSAKNEELEKRIQNILSEMNSLKKVTSDIEAQKRRMESELEKFDSSLAVKDNELKDKEKKLNELENIIAEFNADSLKNPELKELKDKLNELSMNLSSKDKAYNELNQEKKSLSEKLKGMGEFKGEKEDQIAELQIELKQLKKQLEEKIFIGEQQSGIIENQAQKIAELEALKIESRKSHNGKTSELSAGGNIYELKPDLVKESKTNNENEGYTKVESKLENSQQEPLSENGTIEDKATQIRTDDGDILKSISISTEQVKSFKESGNFEHLQYDKISVINVNLSRATLEIAGVFGEFLNNVLKKNYNKLIVNMSKCEFVDSTILGVLVNTLKKATAVNGDLRIVWSEQNESSMFYVTRMDKVFMIFSDLNQAIKSYL